MKMSLIASCDLQSLFNKKDIYLDNDFLHRLSQDDQLTKDFSKLINTKESLKIDNFVRFEFLRDVSVPKQVNFNQQFLSNNFFHLLKNDLDLDKITINAIILSKIYKIENHQVSEEKELLEKQTGPSITDFFLAARMMIDYKNRLLITGNKKHFPSYIFDINHVINTENPLNRKINHFFILSFNKEKFDTCFQKLNRINGNEVNPLKTIRCNLI